MLDTKSTDLGIEIPLLYSEDAEQLLVGCVFLAPQLFVELDISPDDFYIRRYGAIWDAFTRLHKGGMDIDITAVIEVLDRTGKLAEIGGAAALAAIIAQPFMTYNFDTYARIVRDYSRRRSWVSVANQMARLAYDKSTNLEQEAPKILTDLSQAVRTQGTARHISQYTRLVLDEAYERMNDPRDIWGIPTGFIDFDRITGGLHPGEILNISGEPNVGKSIWAMQAGFQMAEAGYPGVIYSIEMPGTSVIRRRVSHQARIPANDIKAGRISEGFPQLVAKLEEMDCLPLYMSDDVQWTTTSLRADLARLKTQHGIQWFVLDYAYLLKDGLGLSENDRTGLISAQLKSICRALELSGIVILSMNKSGMGDLPKGENLRGNNQQFYDTDLLMFIIRPDAAKPEVTCIFGKGRELEKPRQSFPLLMLHGFPAFENAVIKEIHLKDYTV